MPATKSTSAWNKHPADARLAGSGLPAPCSPLRYPGGKARLGKFLAATIDKNDLRGCAYYEPYVGGAGAALALLASGAVSTVYLNDADRRIFSFWRSVLDDTDRFAEKIFKTPVTIQEWKRQRNVCASPRGHSRFDIGFAAFYMNRCNRSGVLDGAGPIGGYKQDGEWRVDVRFSRAALAERIFGLGRLREAIHVSNQDAITFLKRKIPRGLKRSKVFIYLDPPYVNNGQRLYLNYYSDRDHRSLAKYLQSQSQLRWLMSYDESALVRELYAACRVAALPINYSLQVKRTSHELLITPKYLTVPADCHV
jgi:DNA adenine methylase